MPKEKIIKFQENELASELTVLQEELCSYSNSCGNAMDSSEAVWVFRIFQGVSPEEWEALTAKHDLSQWLTLPINGDTFPHLKQFQKTLERLAYQTEHDALTGLANRRAFDRVLDIEMERSRRAKTPLSLAIFDLDDFKRINDTYGHPKGDEVLATFARQLQATTRRYDLAARYGGEEFSLVMAGSGVVKAQRLLTRFLREFKQVEFNAPDNDETFHVTCSVGLTCYKGTSDLSVKEMIELADEALYDAKNSGKDQVKVSRLAFVEDVSKETLVRADEKKFLFGK